MTGEPLRETHLSALPSPFRGKVRDVYDLGDELLIVATDRISAYDHVLRPGIRDKGKLLHQLSVFWFRALERVVPSHLLASRVQDFPQHLRRLLGSDSDRIEGRAALVRKARVVPFECVARGYLAGSGWRAYRDAGSVCGVELAAGLERASRLPDPIFTPATKETGGGHDVNVPYAVMEGELGPQLAGRLRDLTLELYRRGAAHAASHGLILADTKFEFGLADGEVILVDEALTPDSSRYWDVESWSPGTEPVSFDKQFVRNWLDASGWDHESSPPELPPAVVEGTRERYLEAYRRLVGADPEL